MSNTKIGRTEFGYIKRRKKVYDEKQQDGQEFLEVIKKAERASLYKKVVQVSPRTVV